VLWVCACVCVGVYACNTIMCSYLCIYNIYICLCTYIHFHDINFDMYIYKLIYNVDIKMISQLRTFWPGLLLRLNLFIEPVDVALHHLAGFGGPDRIQILRCEQRPGSCTEKQQQIIYLIMWDYSGLWNYDGLWWIMWLCLKIGYLQKSIGFS
jgi:hypothetical protein